jgi:hypothetical protein
VLVANHRKKLYDWVVNERAKGMRISTVCVAEVKKIVKKII